LSLSLQFSLRLRLRLELRLKLLLFLVVVVVMIRRNINSHDASPVVKTHRNSSDTRQSSTSAVAPMRLRLAPHWG
jgi:hypothetical protein